MAKGNGGTLWMTRVYNAIERDPEIDVFEKIYGKEKNLKDSDLAVLAGLSASTVKNMFGGQTRRPQHATFAKMANAMGYKYGLQRDNTPDYESEIEMAREQYREHKAQLAKTRERVPKKKAKR